MYSRYLVCVCHQEHFASALPAIDSEGKVSSGDCFTFRYESQSLGSAEISPDQVSVMISGAPEGTYLVIQTKDDSWSKAVSGSSVVQAKEFKFGDGAALESFQNCKIWLETTNQSYGITSASMAIQKGETNLNSSKFAAKEDLIEKFDTTTTEGKIHGQKVYFGINEQQWYIAGKDEGVEGENIVLFAASSLTGGSSFQVDTYSEQTYENRIVAPNHYGASKLRENLNGMLDSHFSNSERLLMKTSAITTQDTKNASSYTVTDTLYAGACEAFNNSYILLGTEDSLRVDSTYWKYGTENIFYLRTPNSNKEERVLCANYENMCTESRLVNELCYVRPAFALDTASVLFGSSATPAMKEGVLTEKAAYTLRYRDITIGKVDVSADRSYVNVSNAAKNTYLIVQNETGAYAKAVEGTVSFKAEDIVINGQQVLSSFENCVVWLENTIIEERKTRAVTANWEIPLSISMVPEEISILKDESVDLLVKAKGGNKTYYYKWYVENSTQSFAQTNKVTVTPEESTIYKVVVGDGRKEKTATVKVTVIPRTYTIEADKAEWIFEAKTYGEMVPEAQTFMIRNTGNSVVTLKQPSAENYTVGNLSKTELTPGDTAALTIQPKAGLSPGNYNETITLYTNQNTSTVVDVKYWVKKEFHLDVHSDNVSIWKGESTTLTANPLGGTESYTYAWYADGSTEIIADTKEVTLTPEASTRYKVVVSDGVEQKEAEIFVTVTPKICTLQVDVTKKDFGTRELGDDVPEAETITITNTGTVSVVLIQPNAVDYVIGTLSKTQLAAGEKATFTIQPKTGLLPGSYEEMIQIHAQPEVRASFEVCFQVREVQSESNTSNQTSAGITTTSPSSGSQEAESSATEQTTEAQATTEALTTESSSSEMVTTEPASGGEETTEPTSGSEEITEAPSGSEGMAEPSSGSEEPTEEPSGSEGTTEPSSGGEEPTEAPSGSEGTTEPSSGNEETTEAPGGSEGTTEPSSGNEEPTETPSGSEGTTEPSSGSEESTESGSALAAEILKRPVSAVYNCNDKAAALTILAESSDNGILTYQWYRNKKKSTSGGTKIQGANSNSYMPDTKTAGTYYYYCIVTNTNNKATLNKTAVINAGYAKIQVKKLANRIQGVPSVYRKNVASQSFTLKPNTNGTVKYRSTNTKVVTVNSKGKVMVQGVGTAYIMVTAGNGIYRSVTKRVTIKVVPATVKVNYIQSNNKKALSIKWDTMAGLSGFKIQYSVNKDFKNVKTSYVGSQRHSKTRSDLGIGKKYYVRVCAYRKIGKNVYYGAWSKIKACIVSEK